MNGLNPPQLLAATHVQGPLLIFAGAGSGKTRTITHRIAYLIQEQGVRPYRILAVTFTNKAAAEMRERLETLVGETYSRDLWVGTFHGICAKLIRRYPEAARLSSNFVIYDDSDQKAVVSRLVKEQGLDDRRYAPKYVLALISAAKREGHDPTTHPIGDGFDETLSNLGRNYQAALARANAVDFDDLLLRVVEILEDPDNPAGVELRRKFDFVVVDEFQDTNLVQYRIVRALSAETRNLCVVGDDDQSIYRWRGADVRIIRGFRRDFPEAQVVKLEENYRSTGNIVRAALAVIAPAEDREPKELWTSQPPGDPVVIRACADERVEAQFVVESIRKSRAQGFHPKEQAIFYRTHAQSRVLEEALRGAGLPYQIIGGMKFFERAEIKDLLAYLRLIANPAGDTDLHRIINVPLRGIGKKTVDQLAQLASENTLSMMQALELALRDKTFGAATSKKLQVFYDLFASFQKAHESLRPSELLEHILDATGYKAQLEKDDRAESDARLENLAELVGSLREYEEETPETGEPPTLHGYLERIALVAAVDSMEDVPAVSLMTVHSAKGLEFDQVWLTGMEEEIFPYRGLDGADPEELDEERRLAYVAITRARKQLFITHAGARFLFGKTKYLQPSRFLDDLPAEVIRREGEIPSRLPSWASTETGSDGYTSQHSSSWRSGYTPGGANRGWSSSPPLSPGGRAAQSSLQLRPGERLIDRDLGDDTTAQDAYDAAPDDREPLVVRPGQKATHKKFGEGVVERIEGGAEPTLVVRFPGYGAKRILAQYLNFETY